MLARKEPQPSPSYRESGSVVVVEYLAHGEIEEALLVEEDHGGVGRVPGQIVERIGGTA